MRGQPQAPEMREDDSLLWNMGPNIQLPFATHKKRRETIFLDLIALSIALCQIWDSSLELESHPEDDRLTGERVNGGKWLKIRLVVILFLEPHLDSREAF